MSLEDNKKIEEEADSYKHSLSTAIDLAAKRNGINLKELAGYLETSPRALSNWRAGKAMPQKMVQLGALYLLSSGRLKIEDGEFVDGEESAGDAESRPSGPFAQAYTGLSASVVRQMRETSKPKRRMKDYVEEVKEALPAVMEVVNQIPGGAGGVLKMVEPLWSAWKSSLSRAQTNAPAPGSSPPPAAPTIASPAQSSSGNIVPNDEQSKEFLKMFINAIAATGKEEG